MLEDVALLVDDNPLDGFGDERVIPTLDGSSSSRRRRAKVSSAVA